MGKQFSVAIFFQMVTGQQGNSIPRHQAFRRSLLLLLFLGCVSTAQAVMPSFGLGIKHPLADPVAVAVGDFQKDGNEDIVVKTESEVTDIFGDLTQTQTLQLLVGSGDGSFAPSVTIWSRTAVNDRYSTGCGAPMAGDFNGDGNLDVVALTDNAHLTTFLGHGDGTFQQLLAYQTYDCFKTRFLIRDVNGDDKLDMVSQNLILLGNGDGTFRDGPNIDPDHDIRPIIVGVDDFDRNGTIDLLSDCDGCYYSGYRTFLSGRGDGTFSTWEEAIKSLSRLNEGPMVFGGIGDFNGDGFIDSLNRDLNWADGVAISFGRGDGRFGIPNTIAIGKSHVNPLEVAILSVAVADFNLDGFSDFVVLNSPGGYVIAVTGASSLTQITPNYFDMWLPTWSQANYVDDKAGNFAKDITSADLNNDGKPDIIVVYPSLFQTSGISIYLNTTNNGGSTYMFTVTKSGTGSGNVTSKPTGINCGATCSASFDNLTSVTLSATATTGSTFTGWSGDCGGLSSCVLSMNANRSVSASFAANAGTGALSYPLLLAAGWNLIGNSLNQSMPVAAVYGDPAVVTTVWKWDVANAGWQFYAPSMDATALQTYTAGKGYGVLSEINPGEGYWVNAKLAASLGTQSGTAFALTSATLQPGWNLVATGNDVSPSVFNLSLSATPPGPGTVPINLTTLWAWDSALSQWYFYAPSLEANGGLAAYITSKGYLDFTAGSKTLGNGMGFWVNRP